MTAALKALHSRIWGIMSCT